MIIKKENSLLVLVANFAVCWGLSCMHAKIHDLNNKCDRDLGTHHLSSVNISCNANFCSTNFSNPNLVWTLVDRFQGILEVSYDLPQKNCDPKGYFTIELLTNENLNETTCLLTSNLNSLLQEKHSCRQFLSNACSETSNSCSRSVTVPFHYVYTGCYQFIIKSQGYYMHTTRYFITTNYTKSGVDNVIFDFKYKERRELEVTIKMAYPFVPSMSTIEFMKDVDPDEEYPCDTSGIVHATCNTCLDKTQVYCELTENDGSPPMCTYLGDNDFSCTFYEIPPMNYCIKVSYEDDRCQELTVWDKDNGKTNCSMSYLHTAVEIKYDPIVGFKHEPLDSKKITLISAGYLITFMAVAAICCYFIVYKHQRYKPIKEWLVSKITDPRDQDESDEFPPVVLLYTRDCRLFMDAMSKLQTVLKSLGCSEVFDYWDPVRFNEVSEDSCGWMRRLVQDKSVRFIYIATPVSHLVEQSVINPTLRVEFKEPHCFDHLFLFSLKCLEQVIVAESYRRIFVVRIQNQTDDNVMHRLTYLNPLTEYCLSGRANSHLDKLIHDIKNDSFLEFTDVPKVYASQEIEEFNSLLLHLLNKIKDQEQHTYEIVNVYHSK